MDNLVISQSNSLQVVIERSLDLPPFDPVITGEIAKKGAMGSIALILMTGKALQEGKDHLDGGEYLAWVKDTTCMSESTARKYMKAYNRYIENPEAFDAVNDDETKKKILYMSDSTFNELSSSKEDWENKYEKAKADRDQKELKLKIAEEKIESGKEEYSTLLSTAESLKTKIKELKEPEILAEEQIQTAQDYINQAIICINKAKLIQIDPSHKHELMASLPIATKSLDDSWS